MLNNVYVGERYVPIFDPDTTWQSTKTYKPLTIVKYGNNWYTSKKNVPMNQAPTGADNDPYWAETGNYNGYIAELNQRMGALEQVVPTIPKKRRFVLIGDSFGCGIIDATTPWTDGWIDYFVSLFPNDTFRYDPQFDEQLSGLSSFTSTSPASFLNQLNYVYNNKMAGQDPNTITDVIVLGGTNESNQQTVESLTIAITAFCTRSRELYPNAEISIGIVGLHGRHMVYENQTYKGYKNGAMVNGCKFLDSCINLGTLTQYNSGYNHWSAAGYLVYNPYIAEMIIKGDCDYAFKESFANLPIVESDVKWEYGVSFTFNMDIEIHPKFLTGALYTNSGYMNGFIDTMTKMSSYGSTRQGKMLEMPAALYPFDYVYPMGAAFWKGDTMWTSHGRDPVRCGMLELRFLNEGGKCYLTYRGSHPLTGPSGDAEYYSSTLLWNTAAEIVPSFMAGY